jgi:hypothetical protein
VANKVIQDLSQAPLPDMLEKLGHAIAGTQFAMDKNSIAIAEMLGDRDNHGVQFSGEQEKRSLLELGFAPTFYHISEATIDIRISLTMSQSTETSVSASATVGGSYYFVMFAATVSASYTNKYSYKSEASSAIVAKFISVPPPSTFTNLLSARQGMTTSKDSNDNN